MRTTLLVITFALAAALAGCNRQQEEGASPQEPATSQPEPEPSAEPAQVAVEGEMCGGITGLQCAEGQYCATELGQCGVADASGTCKPKPTVCTKDYAPVCGCDGTTHNNACEAASAGVNIDKPGECPVAAASQ